MSLRPGRGILTTQKHRLHTWCTLIKIHRKDNVEFYFTDASRKIWFEGQYYLPAGSASISAESRKSLEEGDLQILGALSSDSITRADLIGKLYDGASIRILKVDYIRPWKVHYETKKEIESIELMGSRWAAKLVGMVRKLQLKFGRRFSRDCWNVLADGRCRADMTTRVKTKIRIVAVSTDRRIFTVNSESGPMVTISAGSVEVLGSTDVDTPNNYVGTFVDIPLPGLPGSILAATGFSNGANNGNKNVISATFDDSTGVGTISKNKSHTSNNDIPHR